MAHQNPLKDFFTFDQATRKGYIWLLCILFLLLGTRIFLQFMPAPKPTPLDAKTQKEWLAFKAANKEKIEPSTMAKTTRAKLMPHAFDPNTVDSFELLQMGLPERTVKYFINWRNKGKIFRSQDDFKEVYTLTDEHYQQLKDYIIIDANKLPTFKAPYQYYNASRVAPKEIDINVADIATLELIRGIGNFTATKIIERRNELGGFINFQQVKEVWKFPDTVNTILEKTLVFNTDKIKKINLNEANFEQLSKHPYIKEKLAKNILLYRDGIKTFTDIKQLKQVPLMDEEKYRKIAPYISLD